MLKLFTAIAFMFAATICMPTFPVKADNDNPNPPPPPQVNNSDRGNSGKQAPPPQNPRPVGGCYGRSGC